MTTLDPKALEAVRAAPFRKYTIGETIDDTAIETIITAYLSALPAQPVAVSDVIAERQRQQSAEGWTEAHDDQHVRGEMALAAACYAVAEYPSEAAGIATRELWPWDTAWWKPKGFRRNLVRAAALIIAEIERLDRLVQRRPELAEPALAAPSQQEGVTEAWRVVIDIASTTALKHREEGRRTLADQIDAAIALVDQVKP